MPCCENITMPCARFVIAATISIITTLFAGTLLVVHGFKDVALTAFATGIISSNITYWSDSPAYNGKRGEETQPINL